MFDHNVNLTISITINLYTFSNADNQRQLFDGEVIKIVSRKIIFTTSQFEFRLRKLHSVRRLITKGVSELSLCVCL